MKSLIFTLAALTFLCGVYTIPKGHLLGKEKCTWGPGYWCTNLTSAAGCHAVKHCIQTVWEHKTYPEDNDSVCSICLDMVKQARDQLESNETQEEIKEVFEGSCKLIPLKLISKECCKVADDFIPELIDTLASQMNPKIVCSVAGLCNNPRIDKLLEEHYDEIITKHPPAKKVDSCTGCHKVVDILENRFNNMSKDTFLKSLLQACGKIGSLADGCSDIVITYFSTIYEYMQNNFNSNDVCLLSGECYTNFHVHKIEITPMSDVGVVAVSDDLPCDFCKQLVGHLRDLLIADTTEEEFKKVLEGLCKQSGKFKDQCLSIVEEYYGVIYQFLVTELNSTELCEMINICPTPSLEEYKKPIAPLLPPGSASQAIKLNQPNLVRVGLNKDTSNVKLMNAAFNKQTPELMQLPIERFNSPNVNNVYNKELCAFCEYFLHYMQQVITEPKTEKQIKEEVEKVCNKLPSSINNTCLQFVENYGDAFVAIFVQEIDPSTICPLLQVCPSNKSTDIEVFMQSSPRDKPNCPLCLFAVTKLEEMIKDRKTKADIKTALSTLCSHLSGNVAEECQDFVNTYTDELVEMLIDDFKPQEVCVYLKLCKDESPAPGLADIRIDGMISTNEIPDFTANGKVIKPAHVKGDKPECILCEFVMEKLQKELENKTTEDEIKQAIHGICNDLPKSISKECNNFVDKYADTLFQLIIASVEPKELCTVMKLCNANSDYVENIQTPTCPLCKIVMAQIEDWLIGSNITEAEVKEALLHTCSLIPKHQRTECDQFIEKYGDKIYKALMMLIAPGDICSMIFLCDDQKESIKIVINECAVCEATVDSMNKILLNPRTNHSLGHVLRKSCRGLPIAHQKSCNKLMDKYGEAIYNLVSHSSDHRNVCKEIGVCNNDFIARPILL